jgi:hypothetical protein
VSLSIAVVTKRTGISLTLRSKVHHLVEVRPTGSWLDRSWTEDVVVLDLDTPAATASAIEHLRASESWRPIVVVAADEEGWEDLAQRFPDLLIVPLPVTAATLLDTVDRAAAAASKPVPTPATVAPSTASIDEPSLIDTSGSVVTTPSIEIPAEAETRPHATPTKHKAPTRRSQATAAPEGRALAGTAELATTRVAHYVELLLRDVSLLPRLSQTAEVVRKDATVTVPADASAVLVPDGDIWRVESGHNLRPLEERLQLDPAHWVVAEVAMQRRGLMIKNTDIARNRLAGAPLASWANWLALPVGDTDVIVVLVRDESAFTKADLARAAEAIAHMASEVRHAVAVRALARALSGFRDLVE